MNIRPLEEKDIQAVKYIHARWFNDEFTFPDFFDKFICRFIIEDDDNEIVCAGGVRLITESIMITDQNISSRQKRDVLLEALNVSTHMANKNDFAHLHAFVQDDTWNKILKKVGFRNCKGNALVIDCR